MYETDGHYETETKRRACRRVGFQIQFFFVMISLWGDAGFAELGAVIKAFCFLYKTWLPMTFALLGTFDR